MEITRLTGKVLFGNITKPKSFNIGTRKMEDNPNGEYRLTLIVDESHPDYKKFRQAIEKKTEEVMASEQYKKLKNEGVSVQFAVKDKQHTDKEGNVVEGKRQISLKRNAINSKSEHATVDIFDKYNQPYRPENDISYGADVQVAFTVGDVYIAKDKTWYLTLYLLAVMIENETTSSYGFVVKEPDISDNFPTSSPTSPPTHPVEAYDEKDLPF
jgi:hypothetical protein